jgi:uncharacterized membrane protein YbhN (UPF0104 family)
MDFGQFREGLAQFRLDNLVIAAAAIITSSLFASLRVRSIASDLGYQMPVRDAVAVLSLGQLGGAIFFQIFGQIAARGSYLAKRNVPFAGTVLITIQERIAAALVSFGLAVIGALYLFHQVTFDLTAGGLDLLRIVIALTVAIIVVAIVWRKQIQKAAGQFTWSRAASILRAIIFSIAVQLSMMAAYVITARAVTPSCELADLASAATLVMLAASIPISFAGWGVREISAVGALGSIGMTAPAALTVAITIGVLSIICAVLLAAVSITRIKPPISKPEKNPSATGANHEEILNAVLPMLVACLLFFQIHVPTNNSTINFNVADPLAIICGVLFLLQSRRNGLPEWRLKHLNLHIAAMTAVITIGLFIGAAQIGWTTWAVVNKFLGWFVLLAYGAAGAMAARVDRERALLTFAATGCWVIVFAIGDMVLGKAGLADSHQFTGFAQNVNAMAFIGLMLLAVGLTLPQYTMTIIVIALIAIIFTGSRAGIGGAGVVLITASILIPGIWRTAIVAVSIASLAVHSFTAAQLGTSTIETMALVRPSSDAEHFDTIRGGLLMFKANMIWGAGLGTFIAQWQGTYPLLIHNSAVWILAEFGLLGAAAFFTPVIITASKELMRFRSNDANGYLVILIIAGFGSMSLFHELLYQRSMWFLLGVTLILIGKGNARANLPKQMI